MGEGWKEYRADQQERNEKRLISGTAQILALINQGYKVERKTLYCFRINDRLDLYPVHRRFHDVKINMRGGYGNPNEFCKNYFKLI